MAKAKEIGKRPEFLPIELTIETKEEFETLMALTGRTNACEEGLGKLMGAYNFPSWTREHANAQYDLYYALADIQDRR